MTTTTVDPRQFLLDEIARFGHTWHGLAFGGQYQPRMFTPYGTFALPFDAPSDYDTHLLRVPGVPELDMLPEELETEAMAGRVWQNYALLSGSDLRLFGKPLGGWVCVDPTGARWLVKTNPGLGTRINKDSPLTLAISVVPFGEIGAEPVDPVSVSVTLADIGQAATDETRFPGDPMLTMKTGSISSNGRKVVIELHNQINDGNPTISPGSYPPSGFLLLELSGPGPNFSASLSVLRSRSQAVGSTTKPTIGGSWTTWAMKLDKVSEEPDPLHDGYKYVTFKPGDLVSVLTDLPAPIVNSLFQCNATATASRDGRVLALVFDEADGLVEFTCSHSFTLSEDHGPPTMQSAAGTLVCLWGPSDGYINSGTGDMVISPKATGTGYKSWGMRLFRNGAEVLSAELKITHQFTRTYTAALDGTGYPYFRDGKIPVFGTAQGDEVVQQSWSMNVGGQSVGGSYPGHDYIYGISKKTELWPTLQNLLGSPRNVEVILLWGEDNYNRKANWSVSRPSNQLVAVSWGEDNSGGSLFRVAKIVAPEADLVPGDPPSSQNYAVVASYHPVTKEIARLRPEITAPFCWI